MLGQEFLDQAIAIFDFWCEYNNFEQLRISINQSEHVFTNRRSFYFAEKNGFSYTKQGTDFNSTPQLSNDTLLRVKTYYIWEHSINILLKTLVKTISLEGNSDAYRGRGGTIKMVDLITSNVSYIIHLKSSFSNFFSWS